jgi:hypothetical protein
MRSISRASGRSTSPNNLRCKYRKQPIGFKDLHDKVTDKTRIEWLQRLLHALQVGVSPLLAEILVFYRSLTYPVFDLLFFWLPFRLAGSIKDQMLEARDCGSDTRTYIVSGAWAARREILGQRRELRERAPRMREGAGGPRIV